MGSGAEIVCVSPNAERVGEGPGPNPTLILGNVCAVSSRVESPLITAHAAVFNILS